MREGQITDYHGAVDGVPVRLGAAFLENDKLRLTKPSELEELIEKNNLKPESTFIQSILQLMRNPLNFNDRYKQWKMKREIKKRGCNAAYYQSGHLYQITDFYKLTTSKV